MLRGLLARHFGLQSAKAICFGFRDVWVFKSSGFRLKAFEDLGFRVISRSHVGGVLNLRVWGFRRGLGSRVRSFGYGAFAAIHSQFHDFLLWQLAV